MPSATPNFKCMHRKTLIKIALFGVAAFGIIFIYHVAKQFMGEVGVADNVSNLQKVYQKGGAQVAATFTNSLIQKFPFEGPINWRLQYWKAPCVILTGKVDTNALHQFINDNPTTQFLWSAVNANGESNMEEGWPDAKNFPAATWKTMWFQTEKILGKSEAVIKGTVDFPTCTVTIQSWGSD